MSTQLENTTKRFHKGGFIAAGIGVLMLLAMEVFDSSLIFYPFFDNKYVNEGSLAMALCATLTMLVWSFGTPRGWWQGALAGIGGAFLPMFLIALGVFPRSIEITLWTFVTAFLSLPLLWFGFKRAHRMNDGSLKAMTYVLCFLATGILLLSVFVLPAIGSISFHNNAPSFGGLTIRSVGSNVTYLQYFPLLAILVLLAAAISIVLALTSQRKFLLLLGAAALLAVWLHYLFGSVPTTGDWFMFRGERINIYGKIHGEAWAGLMIGFLSIIFAGLVNQAGVRDWLLKRSETRQTADPSEGVAV